MLLSAMVRECRLLELLRGNLENLTLKAMFPDY
jgi:hypothetical protein